MDYRAHVYNEAKSIMRIKSKYSLSEITNNLYTFGSEWMLQDYTEYIGLYHTYTTGEVYTEPKWDRKTSKKLIKFVQINNNTFVYNILKPNIKTEYNSIQPDYPVIGTKERKSGTITRYFIKRVNSNNIIEIDEKQFKDFNSKKIDPNVNIVTNLQWAISGNIEDEFHGNIFIPGVITKNQKAIAKSTIPGISAKLTNLLEFYADTEFIVPPDINSK